MAGSRASARVTAALPWRALQGEQLVGRRSGGLRRALALRRGLAGPALLSPGHASDPSPPDLRSPGADGQPLAHPPAPAGGGESHKAADAGCPGRRAPRAGRSLGHGHDLRPRARRRLAARRRPPARHDARVDDLLHHLLGLPLGQAYLIWLVTGLALGAGLAITLIGIPILTLVLASVRPLLAVRARARQLAPRGRRARRAARSSQRGRDHRALQGVLDRRRHVARARLPARPLPGRPRHLHGRASPSTRRAGWLLAAPLLAPLDAIDFGDLGARRRARRPPPRAGRRGAPVASGWISEGMGAASRVARPLGRALGAHPAGLAVLGRCRWRPWTRPRCGLPHVVERRGTRPTTPPGRASP